MENFEVLEEFKESNEITAPDIMEPPKITKVQLLDRLRLKNKILAYQEKFKTELLAYDYKMEQLDNLTLEELQLFLDEIRIAVRQRNSTNMTKSFYFGTCEFFEKASCHLGYNISGFSRVLSQQTEIHKCLDEISLEYEDDLYMPAHIRLPFITLQVAMTLYQIKKSDDIINNEFKKPIKEEIKKEYNDL